MVNHPFTMTLLFLLTFIAGGITGKAISDLQDFLGTKPKRPIEIGSNTKEIILNNEDVIIIFQGQRYYFNESYNKKPKSELTKRKPNEFNKK